MGGRAAFSPKRRRQLRLCEQRAAPLFQSRLGNYDRALGNYAAKLLERVDVQDSHGVEKLIQTPFLIGVLNVPGSFGLEGPPVGTDGTASARQEERSRSQWRGQPVVRRGGIIGRPRWAAPARASQ